MDLRGGAPLAPFAEYGLREHSHSRWQLVEPLPGDAHALEAELQRLDAKLAALDDGSEPDLVTGCHALETRKREFEAQARARFERLEASVTMLYEHECDQARARFAARCEQLQRDMGGAIQREIRRLQRARDGVAVMDRRRMTRQSGNSGYNASAGNGLGGGSDSGPGGYEPNGSTDGSSQGTPVTEKKRMEVLLSATPIFRQLDKKLLAEDVDADMARIKDEMPSFLRDDLEADKEQEEETDEDEERELAELRSASQTKTFKRRRLTYNAKRLPEGQAVVVYRAVSTPAKKQQPGTTGRGRKRESRDGQDQQSVVASGTVTAATSTQVYLLTSEGSFQSFPVDDWKAGRVTVHTMDPEAKE